MTKASIDVLTGTLTMSAVTADSPDGASGWTVQFKRNGANHGKSDSSSPYGPKSASVGLGTYALTAVWSKAGKATVTQDVGTAVVMATGVTYTPAVLPPVPPVPPVPPTPAPGLPAGAVKIADEGQTVPLVGTQDVYYGDIASGRFRMKSFTGSVSCTNAAFLGDPAPMVPKSCYAMPVTTPPVPPGPPVDAVVSAWGAWAPGAWSPCVAGSQSRAETRTRAVVTPASNGGATPSLSETRTVSQVCTVTPPVPPTPPGTKALIQVSDFTYLGPIRVPSQPGNRFRYSHGCLTARRVNGELRLLLSGLSEAVDWRVHSVHELTIPTGLSPTVGNANAPEAALTGSWPDIFDGSAAVQDGALRMWGLHWDDVTQALWWGYSSDYAGGPHNPAIGASTLNANGTVVAHGAWRTDVHSAQACGYMLDIPAWFRPYVGGARLGIGNPPHVNNALCSFGANLHAWNPPALSEPADALTDKNDHAIVASPLLFHPMSHPQARGTNYKTCSWKVNYDYSQGGNISPGLPQFGGVSTSTLLDWMDSCVWIDLPSKHGILFLGQLVDTLPGNNYGPGETQTHVWYGANPCVHGQHSQVHYATGPGAGTVANQAWIYDPMDLIAVTQGTKTSWHVTPRAEFRAKALGNFCEEECTHLYQFGGMYFDAIAKRLYVVECNAIREGFDPLPVVHVFQVS